MIQLVVKEECGNIGLVVMEDDLEDQSNSQSGCFSVLALNEACVTYDSQHRGRFHFSSRYYYCKEGFKSFRHLLLRCKFIWITCCIFLNRFGIVWMMPGRGSTKLAVQGIKKKQRTLLKNIRRTYKIPLCYFRWFE